MALPLWPEVWGLLIPGIWRTFKSHPATSPSTAFTMERICCVAPGAETPSSRNRRESTLQEEAPGRAVGFIGTVGFDGLCWGKGQGRTRPENPTSILWDSVPRERCVGWVGPGRGSTSIVRHARHSTCVAALSPKRAGIGAKWVTSDSLALFQSERGKL